MAGHGHGLVPNALTVDVEHWYHANYPGFDPPANPPGEERLEPQVERLQALAERHDVRVTWFILASVAPQLAPRIRALAAAGHEIASHGCDHRAITSMTPAQIREDVRRSCGILEDIAGERVYGFRAPSFSINEANIAPFYDALEAQGLLYSSSVFPGKTFLYGIPDFPDRVHRPNINGTARQIVEIPVPAIKIGGLHMGLYVRLFGPGLIRAYIRRRNANGRPTVMYVHPREIDPEQPRLDLPRVTRFIHYYGILKCERTLDRVLASNPRSFTRMRDIAERYT